VDDHLGERLLQGAKEREEQAIVARRIEQALRPVSVWVAAAEEPSLVKVHNVQHLATPIRAQLAEAVSCLELAGLLHPTPAVGGEPWERARPLIPQLEGLDRGWYAGTVGWTDLEEDGELCVAIRCALLRGDVAHLYAGNGIVRDSVPADELAETEVKLQAIVPALTGL
jgi:salicylate biosynthesis isochorismate synthase/menaquinone-specific isochorismate synthase